MRLYFQRKYEGAKLIFKEVAASLSWKEWKATIYKIYLKHCH